ncbi:MAG: hypothetical protein ACI9E5_001368 [Candidatus Omnitrophota bacterium]|jgi:hypothetical protein
MRILNFLLPNSFSMNRQSILSVLILFAFLCATLSHSAHSELILDSVELQQCKLCQHNIDTPQNTLMVKLVNICSYDTPTQTIITPQLGASLYFVPQLRAPPFNR